MGPPWPNPTPSLPIPRAWACATPAIVAAPARNSRRSILRPQDEGDLLGARHLPINDLTGGEREVAGGGGGVRAVSHRRLRVAPDVEPLRGTGERRGVGRRAA